MKRYPVVFKHSATTSLSELTLELYEIGRTVGAKTYRGIGAIDFQTSVMRSIIEICFMIANNDREGEIAVGRRDDLVKQYIARNKIGIESRRIRAIVDRLYLPPSEDHAYSVRMKPQVRELIEHILDDKNSNIECEYRIIEDVIRRALESLPAFPILAPWEGPILWNPPIEPYPVKETVVTKPVRSLEESQLRIAIDIINRQLYDRIMKDSRVLKELSWQQVEDLVTEILRDFGYEVRETKRTRDDGIDVFAIDHSQRMGEHLYLVQVKHWRQKIDVKPVRELGFLHNHYRASKSCLATTSRFTSDAMEIFEQYKWVLEPKDFDGILEWVRQAWEIVKH